MKESELQTEVMVEQKRRHIRETKMAADIAMEKEREQLVEQSAANDKKAAEAFAWLGRMHEGALKENSTGLNTAAWFILDHEGLETRDLDLAMKLAVRASEASKGKSAHIEDTLARAHYAKGDLDKAIEIQAKAVQLASNDPTMYQQLSATLQKYRSEKTATGGGK